MTEYVVIRFRKPDPSWVLLKDLHYGELFVLHSANVEWFNQVCIRVDDHSSVVYSFVRLSDGHLTDMDPNREVIRMNGALEVWEKDSKP